MIDGTILSVIPPILVAILTYIVANKRARFVQAKLLADMQSHAIEQIRITEEKMRSEVWNELQKVREENAGLKKEMKDQWLEISNLKDQLDDSAEIRAKLITQVHELEKLVDTYRNRIMELERKG